MATYTAGDQINRALRMLGVLAEGEQPSADMSADALTALNQMLDSWSTERLSTFTVEEQVFTWPAGQEIRTLGPTGNFVGDRPAFLDDSTYFIYNQISYPIDLINQQQYSNIVLKTASSNVPSSLFVRMDNPNITMFAYPVPTVDLEFHFISAAPLTQLSALTTVLAFPPGYLRAFAYNLALEIASEFGEEPSKDVRRIAGVSKRDLKRINDPEYLMGMPLAILPRPAGFNYYTGQST